MILPGQLFVQYHAHAWPRESRGNNEPAIAGGIIVARWRGVFQPFSTFAEASPRLAAARSTGSGSFFYYGRGGAPVCAGLHRLAIGMPPADAGFEFPAVRGNHCPRSWAQDIRSQHAILRNTIHNNIGHWPQWRG